MNQSLYTVDEVARRLKLRVRTVRHYLRSGRLKGTRIGKQYRVTGSDLEAFAGPAVAQANSESTGLTRSVDVSCVVSITAMDKEEVMRLTNMLVAAANSNREHDEPPLRVETIYDEGRALLKVIVIGGCNATSHMLRLVQLQSDS